jgi:hypothetical protein
MNKHNYKNNNMKRYLMCLAALCFIGVSQADYTAIYNNLEKNSIVFKTGGGTTPVEPSNPTCDDDTARSSWTSGSISYQTHTIQWNNEIITTGGNYTMDEYTAGGYHYTKGELILIGFQGEYKQYKVCRVAVN